MASALSVAMSKQEALERINAQLLRLSEEEGRNYAPIPLQGRDADVLTRNQFAHIADTLDALYGAIGAPPIINTSDETLPMDARSETQKTLDALKPPRKGGR